MMYVDDLIIFLDGRQIHSCWVGYERWYRALWFEDKPEQNGCDSSQLWRTSMGKMFW